MQAPIRITGTQNALGLRLILYPWNFERYRCHSSLTVLCVDDYVHCEDDTEKLPASHKVPDFNGSSQVDVSHFKKSKNLLHDWIDSKLNFVLVREGLHEIGRVLFR